MIGSVLVICFLRGDRVFDWEGVFMGVFVCGRSRVLGRLWKIFEIVCKTLWVCVVCFFFEERMYNFSDF